MGWDGWAQVMSVHCTGHESCALPLGHPSSCYLQPMRSVVHNTLKSCKGPLLTHPTAAQVSFGAYAAPRMQHAKITSSTFKIALVASDCVLLGTCRQTATLQRGHSGGDSSSCMQSSGQCGRQHRCC